jgi:hypothetical protein
MLNEIARTRQRELLADPNKIAARVDWELTTKLERLQQSVRVVRARLGLAPLKITG